MTIKSKWYINVQSYANGIYVKNLSLFYTKKFNENCFLYAKI